MPDKKYKCPCCGYYTLEAENAWDTCPVCHWEDDPLQRDEPDYAGGANDMCLNEARQNFKKYGAKDKNFVDCVRKPREDELGPEHQSED